MGLAGLRSRLTLTAVPTRRILGLAAGLFCVVLGLAGCVNRPAPVPLRLLAFNDFHGHLLAAESGTVEVPDPQDGMPRRLRAGGAAHLAALIAQRRAGVPHALVLSTGDLVGASPLTSALFRDEPTIEVMNLIGLDANVVGNHEFDKGVAELMRLIRGGCAAPVPESPLDSCAGPEGRFPGARFTMLGANVIDVAGQPVLPPALVRRIGPVRVGLVGAVTRTTPTIVSPAGVSGLRFEDEAQAINRQVRVLREQGVEAIIALVHEGGAAQVGPGHEGDCSQARGEIFQIIDRLDPAVDLVLSGHTHQVYNCVRRGIRVIQGGSYGRLLSEVDLLLDPASGDVIRGSVREINRPWAKGLESRAADRGPVARGPPGPPVRDDEAGPFRRGPRPSRRSRTGWRDPSALRGRGHGRSPEDSGHACRPGDGPPGPGPAGGRDRPVRSAVRGEWHPSWTCSQGSPGARAGQTKSPARGRKDGRRRSGRHDGPPGAGA